MGALAHYRRQSRVTDRTTLNLLALLVHDRLTHMPDSSERNALSDAWAAVSAEGPIAAPPGTDWKNDWFKEIEQSLEAKKRPAPDMDDPEHRQKAWDDAEAAGLGWPGPIWNKKNDRSDV
jgi:hypothetical protein